MPSRWAPKGSGPRAGVTVASVEPCPQAIPPHAIRRREKGSGRLKTLIWLVFFGSFIYVGIKVVPILLTEYQFQDFMDQTARFATVNRTSAAQISKQVMDEAKQDDIPLSADDLHVTAESGFVNIKADYSVTVDLNVYQWTLNFHPAAGNKPLT